jgi:dTDP-4-dehydrorhamnose reductase
MFNDVHFTPIQIGDLVDHVLELWERGARGTFHVVGGERLSKFDFGRRVATQFGYDPSLIVPRSIDAFHFPARRPRDLSLSSAKAAAALGRPLPDIAAGLSRLARELSEDLPVSLERASHRAMTESQVHLP